MSTSRTLARRYDRTLPPALMLVALALTLLGFAPVPTAHAVGPVVYVKPGGAGDHTGSSWANAANLAPALAGASSGDVLWLAAGMYTPTTTDQRTATFTLKSGVAIYGGFAGTTESLLSQRDPAAHLTVLSGDLNHDDPVITENSYHVVTGGGCDATAILDGVTVSGGNANGSGPDDSGGGIFNLTSSPTLHAVSIQGNFAAVGGGGMLNTNNSNPTLTEVTISGNQADFGGGLKNFMSSPTLTRIVISGNTATQYGGGMDNDTSALPTLTNVVLSGNTATYGGGMDNYGASPILINVTVSGNSATGDGGAIYNDVASSPLITNTILWGNTATNGSAIFNNDSESLPSVNYSLVTGGHAGTGNLATDPLFVTPVPAPAPTTGGDLHVQATSPVIDKGANPTVSAIATDMDGNPRIVVGTVDMGAYEYAQVRYVWADATSGANTGGSWADAYVSLQTALTAASSYDLLWVAVGSLGPYTPGPNRADTFTLPPGVAVYGGFVGSETQFSQRDWVNTLVALSGDIGTLDDPSDNSYHVVTSIGSGNTALATLDGVTISGGNAVGTAPDDTGGGMFITNSSPVLSNVILHSNSASGDGGGIAITANSSPVLTNVTLRGNSATGNGGGISSNGSSPILTNVILSGNSATGDGGGIANSGSNPVLTNVTLSGNSATGNGGGISNSTASSPQIRNSIIWGNTASSGAAISTSDGTSSPVVNFSLVTGGYAGTSNLSSDPLFVTAVPDTTPNTGGDLHLQAGSPAINAGDTTLVSTTTDSEGNARVIGGTVDMGAYEVVFPSVVSIARASAVNPTNASSVTFTVKFNMSVSGVDVINFTDFTVTMTGDQHGAHITAVSNNGDRSTWTVTVEPDANQSGSIGLDLVDADTIITTDAPLLPLGGLGVGNGNFSPGEIYTVDNMLPTVSLSTTAPEPLLSNTLPVTVTFSKAVQGFNQNDLVLINASVSSFTAISPTLYTLVLTPLVDGLVTVDIAANAATDTMGNSSLAATQLSRTYASADLNVVLTSSVADPTNTNPISVMVSLSKLVADFDQSDLVVENGSVSAFSGSGTNYSFSVTPLADGAVTVAVAAGVAHDTTGKGNTAALPFSRTYDHSAPTVVSLNAPTVTSTGATSYTFTVIFSDNLALDLSSFGATNLRVRGPDGFDQPATLVSVMALPNDATRTATYRFTPPGGSWDEADKGAYSVDLLADTVRDIAHNAAVAASLGSFQVTLTPTTPTPTPTPAPNTQHYVYLPLVLR